MNTKATISLTSRLPFFIYLLTFVFVTCLAIGSYANAPSKLLFIGLVIVGVLASSYMTYWAWRFPITLEIAQNVLITRRYFKTSAYDLNRIVKINQGNWGRYGLVNFTSISCHFVDGSRLSLSLDQFRLADAQRLAASFEHYIGKPELYKGRGSKKALKIVSVWLGKKLES